MPPDLGQRYTAIRRLGEGGQGSVWLASDSLWGRQVAVKLLRGAREQSRMLRREFAVLGRLTHPGLAMVHDLGFSPAGDAYMVSEYVDARPLGQWWNGRERREVLAAVARLLGTLDFLHRRELVHRDVKPANVLICGEMVKLVDFGLASAAGKQAELSGTPGFMAPEVLAGEAATPASDLYAVGVMLYLSAWGRMPFEGGTSEMIRAQLSREAELPQEPAPPESAPDNTALEKPLRELIRQLLARDPAQRPGSAAETLSLLEELPGQGAGQAAANLAGQGLPAPMLVGRDAQLAVVERALDGLDREAGTRGLMLFGHPGAGRRRICREVAVLASLAGHGVQWGLGHEVRGHDPSGDLQFEHARLDPAGERARGIARLAEGVARRGAEPLVLLLDGDLDELGMGVLEVLAQREDLRLLVCVTASAGGEARQRLEALPGFSRLELGPLNEREVAELVSSMLPAGWSSGDLAARIHRQSGGNPSLACELTRVAAAARLEQGEGVDLASVVSAPDPDTRVVRLAAARVRALAPGLAQTAAMVALWEAGLPLAQAGELDPAGLDWLVHHGVLQRSRDHLRVAGRALAAALLKRQTIRQRQKLARAALELLDRAAPSPRARALLLLNGALGHSEPDALLAGARDARQALDLEAAARLHAAAREHLSDGARQEATRELASLLHVMGQGQQALALLEQAADEASGEQRTPALCALADAQLRAGAVEQGLATLASAHEAEPSAVAALRGKLLLFDGQYEQALEAVAALPKDAEAAVDAWHTRGLCHYYLGQLDRAQQALAQAADGADELAEPLARARVTNSQAMVHQRRAAFPEARACYLRCVDMARQAGHLPFEATFLMNLASVVQQTGDLPGALQHYQDSLAAARRFGGRREIAQVLHNQARLHALLGQQDRALTCLRRSLGLTEELGWTSLTAHNLLLRAEVGLDRGAGPEQTEVDLASAHELLAELGDRAGQADVGLARARALASAGRPVEAARAADRVLEQTEGMDSIRLHAHLLRGRAELDDASGEPVAALEHLRLALRLAEDTGEQEPLVQAHHQLARAHAACDDPVSAGLHRDAARRLLSAQADNLPSELRAAFLSLPWRAAVMEAGAPATPPSSQEAAAAGIDGHLLAALLQINKELNAEPDLKRLLERIIDHAVDLTGAERGFMLLTPDRSAGGDPIHIEVARNIDQETIRRKAFKISRSVAEEVLRTGAALLTVNAMEEDRFSDFLSVHDLRLRSIVCVPMTIRRQVRGAIYLDNRFQTRTFTRQHQDLLSALADQAGLAVGNRELLEDNQRRQQELIHREEELRRLNVKLQRAMEQQSLRLDELTSLTRSQQGELEGRYQFDNLVGQSAPMTELFRLMDRVKGSMAPVYIFGESGTGKELVAKALHYNSDRSRGPFISVNCGAIPATLLESELFGYDKGAFTGADRRRKGLFERAHEGSLFLDEVGDMPAELQVRLLRVLQDKRFTRLGGEQEHSSDFRLLAASNKDLQQLVSQGTFREDLYYRINVIRLPLPPLRRRQEDIPLLVKFLLERHGGAQVQISSTALGLLMEYPWPGNVRELENEVLRMLALGGEVIQPRDLSAHISQAGGSPARTTPAEAATLKQAVRHLERDMAEAALRLCDGRVTAAAARLGMSRVGLHKLMKRHGLKRDV